jgi:hypothetical protein
MTRERQKADEQHGAAACTIELREKEHASMPTRCDCDVTQDGLCYCSIRLFILERVPQDKINWCAMCYNHLHHPARSAAADATVSILTCCSRTKQQQQS